MDVHSFLSWGGVPTAMNWNAANLVRDCGMPWSAGPRHVKSFYTIPACQAEMADGCKYCIRCSCWHQTLRPRLFKRLC